MVVDIHSLIGAINPWIYCKKYVEENGRIIDVPQKIISLLEEAKEEKKKDKSEEEPYLKVAKIIKDNKYLKESEWMDIESELIKNPFKGAGQKNPCEKHSLSYDAYGESLEPIYFWLTKSLSDIMGGAKVEKLIDNFISSPGSAHFAEIGQRATRMQEEAMKILGTVNTLIKSILNLIYDLKEFKMRLSLYDTLKSKEKEKREAALISLKQLWLDTVDIKRGNTSLKGMASQYDYVTLIDAFMAVEDESLKVNGVEIDLNDRVKRIIKQRIFDFNNWVKLSESELRKRYEIEKIYLKSQVASIKLYARWVKPYLKAAQQLEQRARETADLVNLFNTSLFELILLGTKEYDYKDDVNEGLLPKTALKEKLKKIYSTIIIELNFRSVPEKIAQSGGYGFRGKIDITFTSYALSEKEIKTFKENLEKDDLKEIFGVIENLSDESLAQIQSDIDELLDEKKPVEEKEEKKEEDINPFSALFNFLKSPKKREKEEEKIEKDSGLDFAVRSLALIKTRMMCRKIYDIYKKSHSMPAFPAI